MAYNPNTILIHPLRSINGLVTGSYIIFYTQPAQGRFVISSITMVPKNILGVGSSPSINIGWTPTMYADVVSAWAPTITTINSQQQAIMLSNYTSVPPDTKLFINITTPATGYTSYTFDIYVSGFYESV